MNAVVTIKAREKMLKARAGEATLPKIVGFAFGNGGVDSGGNVIEPSEESNSLSNELLRKKIDGYQFTSNLVCRYSCTLEKTELAGYKISELALYDEDGDLVAIKNCLPKGKDDDLEMTFQIDDSMETK
jgi:phage-related tail fiber protein